MRHHVPNLGPTDLLPLAGLNVEDLRDDRLAGLAVHQELELIRGRRWPL